MSPRIGLDYLPAVCHAPGIGRYGRELVRALVQLPDVPELRLFEVGGGERAMEGAPLGLAGASVFRRSSRAPRRAVEWLHRVTGLGADRLLGGVDLFHRMHAGYPPVSAALQLLPLAELPPAGSRADAALAGALDGIDDVLVFCEHYREQVARRYGMSGERVHTVAVGCDHWRRDLADATVAPATPARLLVLGAVRSERHPLAVLRALEALRAGGVEAELVFIGRPGDAAGDLRRALRASPAGDVVRWIESPVERDMPALLASATVLVHLADDEGTAVTPLEAFSLGVPVVATRLPAFEEALGGGAELLPAPDTHAPAALAEAIARAIRGRSDGPAAAHRRALAEAYPWDRNARETLGLWRRILARGR
ncbi:MAG: glycosyltransferase [Planctomycetota bacterium]|nr:MAG: glycosyltransferase [Planctomycetota bacterium]